MLKARDYFCRVQGELFKSLIKVEQVAPLSPLQQRPQFCPEKLFRFEGDDVRRGLMPVIYQLEWVSSHAEHADVLARVEFDLQIEGRIRRNLRREPEGEMRRM